MKRILISIFVLVLFAENINSQDVVAKTKYQHFAYQDAIKQYKKILRKDKNNGLALFNLANAYRLNGNTTDAELWFSKAVVFYPEPECKLFYAQTLLSNKKYLKAKEYFDSYSKVAKSETDKKLAQDMMFFCQDLNDNGVKEMMYNIKAVNFNGEDYDYSPTFYTDSSLVFVSNREYDIDKKLKRKKIDKWTGERYMKLFLATYTGNAVFGEPQKLLKETDAFFHEGPAVFNNDRSIMYYTKNIGERRKKNLDDNNNTRLGIFMSNNSEGKWTSPEPVSFTNQNFSVEHPALSADEDFMIFASDMPGGFGGTDLYISYYQGNAWGVPENLGNKINTAGNEVFPFLDKYNNLYFSSNLLIGFGGLDIFKCFYSEKKWSEPENFGAPINSSKDDFGFAISSDWTKGFFSSNRDGNDNIYTFDANYDMIVSRNNIVANNNDKKNETKPNNNNKNNLNKKNTTPEESLYVCGTVINRKYKTNLKDAKVKVISLCQGEEIEYVTDENGGFGFKAPKNCDYIMLASKDNFRDTIAKISTAGATPDPCLEVIIPLTFKESTIADLLNVDLKENKNVIVDGMVIELYNIYFDLDKYFIRTDAVEDLENLYKLLIKYPNMTGEIGAHTDSRAPFDYNIKLSENRAKSAVKYLTDKGIAKNRLTWKGYGETKLKNNCADSIDCTELQHQRNRRVEFTVTYFDGVINSKEEKRYVE